MSLFRILFPKKPVAENLTWGCGCVVFKPNGVDSFSGELVKICKGHAPLYEGLCPEIERA